MGYKIIRVDGKEDKLTSYHFESYDDAYDLLEKVFGEMCCSDADFENTINYDIVEN